MNCQRVNDAAVSNKGAQTFVTLKERHSYSTESETFPTSGKLPFTEGASKADNMQHLSLVAQLPLLKGPDKGGTQNWWIVEGKHAEEEYRGEQEIGTQKRTGSGKLDTTQ